MSLEQYNKEEGEAIEGSYSFDYDYEFTTFNKYEVAKFFLSHKDRENYCIEFFDADADGEFMAGSDFETVDNFLKKYVIELIQEFYEIDLSIIKMWEKYNKIYLVIRKSGDIIDEFDTIKEGIQMIEYYKKKDIEDGIYEENFYALEDKEHNVIYF